MSCSFDPDSPCLRWPLDSLGKAMERAVRCNLPGTGFIDLSPNFADAAARGEILYLPDDTHWSASGHRLAAEILASYLDRRRDGPPGDSLARGN